MSISPAAGDETSPETEVVIHRLIASPERWGADGAGLIWNEVLDDGTVEVRVWTADDPADRARLEAFWSACQGVDWDDLRVREIPATSPKRRTWTRPAPVDAPPRPEGPPPEFTDAGLIRRAPRDPAPVAESWRRIEAWMTVHCPEVVAQLLPGVPEADIEAFERAIGQRLPEDVKASFRVHEGLGRLPDEYLDSLRGEDDDDDVDEDRLIKSVIYDYSLDSVRDLRTGCEPILPNWRQWTDFADVEDEGDPESGGFFDYEVFPEDAIQVRYACRGWIPLYTSFSNHLGVDLMPGPRGVVGQVIHYGRDEDQFKSVLALSWGQFLEDYADELEAGNYHFTGGPDDPIGDRHLYMKRPQVSSIIRNWKRWADAKLPDDFVGAGRPPTPEPTPADPETGRECRAAVDGFLAAYRAWEVRWLAVRPLETLGFNEVRERGDGTIRGDLRSPSDFLDAGLPVPEAVALREADPTRDYFEFWDSPRLKGLLDVGPHYAPAMAERSAIYARYLTAWAVRSQGATFTLHAAPRFSPETYEDLAVERVDEATALATASRVESRSYQGDRRARFVLRREADAWRIERIQFSTDDGPWRSKTIA